MKLITLTVKNFRGLKGEKNIIDFSKSNIIFLIGQNNVGKSTFLRAYEFFVNSSQRASFQDFNDYNLQIPIEIEGTFLKEIEDENNDEFVGTGRNAEPDWIGKWVDSNNIVKIKKIWQSKDEAFKKFTYSPQNQDWVENGFGGFHSLFQKYAPTPISINAMETEITLEEKVNKLIQDDFLKKLKDDYPTDYEKIINEIKELENKITGSDAIETYNNALNEYFKKVFTNLTLKIVPKTDETLKLEDLIKKNHSVNVLKDGIERNENFTQYGHGVIRQALFNFICFLKKSRVGPKKEYIILYEEPELFIHPEIAYLLRKSLYELAENSPYQILCSTHSPLMIDVSKQHTSLVRIVKNNDETTETYQVGDDVFRGNENKKQRIQMINRFNPHVCEAFYAKKVIIVEGDTEAIVFRELIQRFFNENEIYILNSGSKNNIPFFQEIFTAFSIEHYVIHDTDTRLNDDGSRNSAWTLNTSILENVNKANETKPALAKRYVFLINFESAHDIKLTGKDKPLNAYEFSLELNFNSEVPCLQILKDIMEEKKLNHDDEYIENQVYKFYEPDLSIQ